MGLRFNRRTRILPGVRINLSKSGVSTSIGGRGAWLTLGKRGVRTTVGIPGTGLSYTATSAARDKSPEQAVDGSHTEPGPPGNARRGFVTIAIIIAVVAWIVWSNLK